MKTEIVGHRYDSNPSEILTEVASSAPIVGLKEDIVNTLGGLSDKPVTGDTEFYTGKYWDPGFGDPLTAPIVETLETLNSQPKVWWTPVRHPQLDTDYGTSYIPDDEVPNIHPEKFFSVSDSDIQKDRIEALKALNKKWTQPTSYLTNDEQFKNLAKDDIDDNKKVVDNTCFNEKQYEKVSPYQHLLECLTQVIEKTEAELASLRHTYEILSKLS